MRENLLSARKTKLTRLTFDIQQTKFIVHITIHEIYYFPQAGHKVDFFGPCGTNKSILWPPSGKKIMCDTGKTLILLMWLLPCLCSGIKLHTRKINFSSLVSQYTIFYYRVIKCFLFPPTVQTNLFFTSGSLSIFYYPMRGQSNPFSDPPSRKKNRVHIII